jgi:hypothetical protein
MDYRERQKLLGDMMHQHGFTQGQVEHLGRLSRAYPLKEIYITSAEQRRLEFIRWLVVTGRMSEQIA